MKVYRVVPIPIDVIIPHKEVSLESMYYDLGCMSYKKAISYGDGTCNNIDYRIKEPGDFYFIFIEDALNYVMLRLFDSIAYKVLEYDFEEEVVYSLIGWGKYKSHDGYDAEKRAETYIGMSQVPGELIKFDDISRSDRENELVKTFKDVYSTLKSHNISSDELKNIFGDVYPNAMSLTKEEIIRLFDETDVTNVHSSLVFSDRKLIRTGAVTHKSAIILYKRYLDLFDQNKSILEENGFTLDYSKEGIALRNDYTRLIDEGQHERAREYLKSYRG